jgi:hypothetical protein
VDARASLAAVAGTDLGVEGSSFARSCVTKPLSHTALSCTEQSVGLTITWIGESVFVGGQSRES